MDHKKWAAIFDIIAEGILMLVLATGTLTLFAALISITLGAG